ncbi:MAG: peptide ABC transporter substrate-binding protein, partial [Alphaproteobacteria bacterium]|nr:peptide ABC transporter substrate-binding protein [Alphaproteobacteria bacterium]
LDKHLFGGKQPVADTAINPLDWVHADDIVTYPYDPGKAAELLDAAGWRRGAGGIRRDAAGTMMSLELMSTAGARTRELVEQILQSQWKALGVEVPIHNEPARVLIGDTMPHRRYAMAMIAWVSSPENVPRTTLHSSMIPTLANNWAGDNFCAFADPEMDTILERIEEELDPAKRKILWHRFQEIYAEQLPALPLYFRADPFIVPAWLKGVEPTGHDAPSTLWVERWREE